jgi:NAD(P)-dependent dehydrogenase (short-subunit alcohol dehydrogenase family)
VRGDRATEGLPGTIDDTADQINARGGRGIAVRCDHTCDEDVEQLFVRLAEGGGRLDILVNNAWSGYERGDAGIRFDAPFWEQPLWRWDLFMGSLRGQMATSRLAAPMMLGQRSGLIVNISFTDGDIPLGQTGYDVVKHASDRMAMDMALELRRHNVAAIALHPGFVRTERVEAAWDLLGEGPAKVVHSVEYVGRAIANLAVDPGLMELSGSKLAVGDLACRYGFPDVDGRQPPPFHLEGRMSLATRMERLNRVTVQAREALG